MEQIPCGQTGDLRGPVLVGCGIQSDLSARGRVGWGCMDAVGVVSTGARSPRMRYDIDNLIVLTIRYLKERGEHAD